MQSPDASPAPIMLGFGLWWLQRVEASARRAGEGFGKDGVTSVEAAADDPIVCERATTAPHQTVTLRILLLLPAAPDDRESVHRGLSSRTADAGDCRQNARMGRSLRVGIDIDHDGRLFQLTCLRAPVRPAIASIMSRSTTPSGIPASVTATSRAVFSASIFCRASTLVPCPEWICRKIRRSPEWRRVPTRPTRS